MLVLSQLVWLCVCVCVCGIGNGNPLQYSRLEISMSRGAWWAKSIGSKRVGYG